MTNNPVFIIGAARSGTKFVRDSLATDAAFKCVPYDVNYIWRMFDPAKTDDVLSPEEMGLQKRQKIRKTLFKLAGLREDDTADLLEKTVSNSLRIPFVDAVFPNARYIHLIRDGRAVVESSLRMWQAPPDKQGLTRKLRDLPLSNYGYLYWFATNYLKGKLRGRSGGQVWGPRYPGILEDLSALELIEVVALQWKYCVEFAIRDLATVPSERKFELRYEDLEASENKISELCDFLEPADKDGLVSCFADRFSAGNMVKWRDDLDDEQVELIENHCGDLLKQLGYEKA